MWFHLRAVELKCINNTIFYWSLAAQASEILHLKIKSNINRGLLYIDSFELKFLLNYILMLINWSLNWTFAN